MDDTISRQAAKDMIKNHKIDFSTEKDYRTARACVNAVPLAQPEIICCKDCVKHNKGIGDIEEQPYGLRKHIMKDESCPLVSWRGKAQGHEFDYQFCAYGKRREVTT